MSIGKQEAEYVGFGVCRIRDEFCNAIYGIFLDTKYEILYSMKYEKNFHLKS